MDDITTYFCTRCMRTVTKAERRKFGKGGVCPECHEALREQVEDLQERVSREP